MNLEWSPDAIDDIRQTREYIAKTLKNPGAASRIQKMIVSGCKRLKQYPLAGPSLESRTGAATDLRYLICENWLAFYLVLDDTVRIVRVLDGRTDYLQLLFDQTQN